MKTLIICLLLGVFFQSNILAQPKKLFKPQTLQQVQTFQVKSDNNVTAEQGGNIETFKLQPWEKYAVTKIGTKPVLIDTTIKLPKDLDTLKTKGISVIPEIYYAKDRVTNKQISYVIFFVEGTPLRLDTADNVFKGIIRFLPVQSDTLTLGERGTKILEVPDTIHVSYGKTSTPIVISQINYPPIDVEIKDDKPIDSVFVKILTKMNIFGYNKTLFIEPAIVLSSNRSTIQGFGIQSMPFYVTLKGITTYKPIPIALTSTLGDIDSTILTLTNNYPVKIQMKSEWFGTIKISVAENHYVSNSLSVAAVFPWVFLLLSVLGGLLGGVGKKWKGRSKITARVIGYSCFIGLFVAVAWGLGINLLPIAFESRTYNELTVFGIGLFAGYFGIIKFEKPNDSKK